MRKSSAYMHVNREQLAPSSDDFAAIVPSEMEYRTMGNGGVAVTPMDGRKALFRTIYGPGREAEADAAAESSAYTAGLLRHGDLVDMGRESPGSYDQSKVYPVVPDMSETKGFLTRGTSSPVSWDTPVPVYVEDAVDESPESGYTDGRTVTVRRKPWVKPPRPGMPAVFSRLSRIPESMATFLHEMAHVYNPVALSGGSKDSAAKWMNPAARIIKKTLQPMYKMYFSRPVEKQVAAAAQKALFMSRDEDHRDLAAMKSDREAADAWGEMILGMAGGREGPVDGTVYGRFLRDAMADVKRRMPKASPDELRAEIDRMYGEKHLGGDIWSRNPAFDPHLGSSVIDMFLKLYRARGESPEAQKVYDRFMNDWGRALRRADNGRRRTGPVYSGTMNA